MANWGNRSHTQGRHEGMHQLTGIFILSLYSKMCTKCLKCVCASDRDGTFARSSQRKETTQSVCEIRKTLNSKSLFHLIEKTSGNTLAKWPECPKIVQGRHVGCTHRKAPRHWSVTSRPVATQRIRWQRPPVFLFPHILLGPEFFILFILSIR